ncbi:MAG: hypothetical protein AAGJ82_11140, partial [Bacteroidota bacterium]
PPQTAAVLSHPLGDVQKIAIANVPSTVFNGPINWNNEVTTPAGNHFRTTYASGFIEVGSSGAALLDENHRLTGHMHGASGTPSCEQTRGFFGRLAMAWECGDPSAQLSSFLDPLDSDTLWINALEGLRSPVFKTDAGEPVPNVRVDILIDDWYLTTVTTDAEGRLPLPAADIPSEGTIHLEMSKPSSYTNGVTVTDLIRMQRHVLTTVLLEPYKILACDVNLSNSLTTLDLIRIRKAILNITPDFGNDSAAIWQFFPAQSGFEVPTQPWPAAARENRFSYELSPNLWLPDFVVVKSGDANGSASLE